MTTVERVSWSLLLLLGAFVVYESLQINYYGSDFGPGPGFFSFWLGILVVVLSGVELIRTRGKREPVPPGFFPSGSGVARIGAILGALVGALLLLGRLGFSVTMFMFAAVLLRVLGRQPWWLALLLAFAGSFGTAYVFRQLQVLLPRGILGM
ncbi:MAG: tripartite tricarboxylate transporter TctB family protein [Candidatus Methylomirabilales bacterium]